MLDRYYIEKEKQEKLLSRKNVKSDFYNGIYDRYEYPVLTREHIPLTWRYDLNPKTNPYFMERLGINAVMNSGAIELNGKYYLVARIEGNDRKSFFGVAESDNGVDGFQQTAAFGTAQIFHARTDQLVGFDFHDLPPFKRPVIFSALRPIT